MNSKELQGTIDLRTVKTFKRLLNKSRPHILFGTEVFTELELVKGVLNKIEADVWEKRSTEAAKEVSAMTEEERRIKLMSAKEKAFFLNFKKTHPLNKWDYYNEYQETIQQEYKSGLNK
jgi:hypothetical protein